MQSKGITKFRPISLLNVEGKIFFGVLVRRMTNFLISNHYINTSVQKTRIPGFPGCLDVSQVVALRVSLEESRTPAVQWKSKRKKKRYNVDIVVATTLEGECSARGRTYIICNKKGHFANVCRSKKQDKKKPKGATKPQWPKKKKKGESTQQYKMKAIVARAKRSIFIQFKIHRRTPRRRICQIKNRRHIQGQIFVNTKIDRGSISNLLPKKLFKKLTGV